MDATLTVNGREHRLSLNPRMTLRDTLRERPGLTGAKKGCDQGQCGACTVLVGGDRVLACFVLAGIVDGEVTTIEGLATEGGPLHPMQQAFLECDAYQCGYCTPGQILSAVACVREGHPGTEGDVREYGWCAAPRTVPTPCQHRPSSPQAVYDDAAYDRSRIATHHS